MKDNDFLERIADLCDRADRLSMVTKSAFLNLQEQQEAIKFLNRSKATYFFEGGYEDAERKLLLILPPFMDTSEISLEEHIAALEIIPSCTGLSHRDYLGAILNLGIKRTTIGDIIVEQKRAVMMATSNIAPYLLSSLDKVGKASTAISYIDLSEIAPKQKQSKIITASLMSLRLDAYLAAAYKLPRTKAVELIESGYVSINHLPALKPSASIKEGDVISARKFGRSRLIEASGVSRKGRTFAQIEIYL